MPYYLDSSAWVKRYFHESGSERVNGLFEPHEVLACSPLGLVEVAATMARKRKSGEVVEEEYAPKRALLARDWRRFLRVELTPAVTHRASNLADAHALRGADTVHLASALALKEQLAEVTLVTSDLDLKAAAMNASLPVIDPQEQTDSPISR